MNPKESLMSLGQNHPFTIAIVAGLLGAACGGATPTSTAEEVPTALAPTFKATGHQVVGSLTCPTGTFAVENPESNKFLFANSSLGYIAIFLQDPATGEVLFQQRAPANKTIVECTWYDEPSDRTLIVRGFFTPAN
jgi:hypothetical protein